VPVRAWKMKTEKMQQTRETEREGHPNKRTATVR